MLNPTKANRFIMAVAMANFLPYITRAMSSYLTLFTWLAAAISSMPVYQETKPPRAIRKSPSTIPFYITA